MEFKEYVKRNVTEARPVTQEEIRTKKLDDKISISKADKDNGSPKEGDMIARNPDNHNDQWLIAKEFFEKNYKLNN